MTSTAGWHPEPASAHPGVHAFYGRLAALNHLVGISGTSWFPDLSEFNGPPDWNSLEAAHRADTISAVAMRAGFGTVRADLQFARNQLEARARGIPVIYYWFCYPAYNAPAAESAMFNATVGPLRPGEAMCGDFEDDPAARLFPRGTAGLQWCRDFLSALQAPANASWWYTYPFLLSTVGLQALIGAWPFWEADYSTTPDSAFGSIIARQFTDCGSTPGVAGCCDQSRVLRGPLSQWLTPGGPEVLDSTDPIVQKLVGPPDAQLDIAGFIRDIHTGMGQLVSGSGAVVYAIRDGLAAVKVELDQVAAAQAGGTPADLSALQAAIATVDQHAQTAAVLADQHLANLGKHVGVDVATGADT
jgi:GH25 family lysozyme M1 (1,4-beta-N-acetylmuramidase)